MLAYPREPPRGDLMLLGTMNNDLPRKFCLPLLTDFCLQPIAASVPMYVSGSADLHGSNKNYIKGGGDFGVNLGKRRVLRCQQLNGDISIVRYYMLFIVERDVYLPNLY